MPTLAATYLRSGFSAPPGRSQQHHPPLYPTILYKDYFFPGRTALGPARGTKTIIPMNSTTNETPLVYSCSGCSSAAQMANYLALQLDRQGEAEMSCIAGVGGNVKKLVKTALSGRKIIAIDGCPLACVKACLNNHDVEPTVHMDLSKLGVAKKQHVDFDKAEADAVLETLIPVCREAASSSQPQPLAKS